MINLIEALKSQLLRECVKRVPRHTYLGGVWHDESAKALVSTDMQRTMIIFSRYSPRLANHVISIDDGSYICVSQVKAKTFMPKPEEYKQVFMRVFIREGIVKDRDMWLTIEDDWGEDAYDAWFSPVRTPSSPVRVNGRYLRPLEGFVVKVAVKDAKSPVLFYVDDTDDFYMVSPIIDKEADRW